MSRGGSPHETEQTAREAAAAAARSAYGKLVASLVKRCGDITAAEDALSEAFAAALVSWSREGVPERPEAWLLTAARRRLFDQHRRSQVRRMAEPDLVALMEDTAARSDADALPDERLQLLFMCAHPAIDAAVRTPLMLQTVLGLDAAQIANAFLVSPAAMAQRLVRAKRKIADARIPFAVPDRTEAASRLNAVLDAIYAAYGTAHGDPDSAGDAARGLAEEVLFLARLTAELAAEDSEASGLLSLILLSEARRPARRSASGRFTPLAEQDVALWSRERIDAGEAALRTALARAATAGAGPGRFTLEAAIQSAHASRIMTGRTPWADIANLYSALIRIAPSIGAQIARAAALCEAGAPATAIAALDSLPAERLATHQPFWATRAHVLARLNRTEDARAAYERSIGLTQDPGVRAWLGERLATMGE